MTLVVRQKIEATLREVVGLLVASDFAALEGLTKGVRLRTGEMRQAIHDYGRALIIPPESAFKKIDVIQVAGKQPEEYSVRFSLWTKQEGRSDLSLDMTFIDQHSARMRVEMDGILVF